MIPGPSSWSLGLRAPGPLRSGARPSAFHQSLRNGLRAAGAAAFTGGAAGCGLAIAGSRPLGSIRWAQ